MSFPSPVSLNTSHLLIFLFSSVVSVPFPDRLGSDPPMKAGPVITAIFLNLIPILCILAHVGVKPAALQLQGVAV